MIQNHSLSKDQVAAALASLKLGGQKELRTYAGFSEDSESAGEPRRTVSLILTNEQIEIIKSFSKKLYNKLYKDIDFETTIPFDVIRYDCYFDAEANMLSLLEINTRNVGLHEIVEWLDLQTSQVMGLEHPYSLNRHIAQNQRKLLIEIAGESESVAYVSRGGIPRWLYFDALKHIYNQVDDYTDYEDMIFENSMIIKGEKKYSHLIRKMAPKQSKEFYKVLDAQSIAHMQPFWVNDFGKKDYLASLEFEEVLKTSVFDKSKTEEYKNKKDQLVCKIIGGGGSYGVHLGVRYDAAEWSKIIDDAARAPTDWIIQDYRSAGIGECVEHGTGKSRTMPFQLGVFVLPDENKEPIIDIVVKAYAGGDEGVMFDPSGMDKNIWFGNVVVV